MGTHLITWPNGTQEPAHEYQPDQWVIDWVGYFTRAEIVDEMGGRIEQLRTGHTHRRSVLESGTRLDVWTVAVGPLDAVVEIVHTRQRGPWFDGWHVTCRQPGGSTTRPARTRRDAIRLAADSIDRACHDRRPIRALGR